MLRTIRSSNPAAALVSALRVLAIVCAVIFAASQPALADPLDAPRAAGLVGERYDGYAQLRDSNAPADVAALVRSINRQRKDYYDQIAKKENVSPTEVGKLYANKIYQSAPRGYWFMDQSGQWKRKF
ncbi:YdbL family protein [Hwanghaeella sp.]|uniref:YdbL family protein n=1 Tax=Hwanghaeella sp. TaxID=2605943 RepID=UPI003CCB8E22